MMTRPARFVTGFQPEGQIGPLKATTAPAGTPPAPLILSHEPVLETESQLHISSAVVPGTDVFRRI